MTINMILDKLQDKGKKLDIKTKNVTLKGARPDCFTILEDGESLYIHFAEGHEIRACINDIISIEPSLQQEHEGYWGINYFHKPHK